jgi:L-fucose mutarotase
VAADPTTQRIGHDIAEAAHSALRAAGRALSAFRIEDCFMLKGIHPLLSPELLHALANMGHGDEIAIVDANFPAASLGPRLFELRGASSPDALDAVLTLFPVDTEVTPAAYTMEVVGDPSAVPEAVMDFAAVFTEHRLADCEIGSLERYAFYDRAKRAFALIRTGELRPYGNILLVKGVVNRFEPSGRMT